MTTQTIAGLTAELNANFSQAQDRGDIEENVRKYAKKNRNFWLVKFGWCYNEGENPFFRSPALYEKRNTVYGQIHVSNRFEPYIVTSDEEEEQKAETFKKENRRLHMEKALAAFRVLDDIMPILKKDECFTSMIIGTASMIGNSEIHPDSISKLIRENDHVEVLFWYHKVKDHFTKEHETYCKEKLGVLLETQKHLNSLPGATSINE